MRETTTMNRRVIMAKVKSRPNQRHPNVTPNRPYNPAPKVVPVLFNRSSVPRKALAIPLPWWNDWKVIAFAVSVILALLSAIYFATQSNANPNRTRPRATQQEVLKLPSEVNIRPMGHDSSRPSSGNEMPRGNAGSSEGSSGLRSMGDDRLSTTPAAKQRSGGDELSLTALEQSKNLVLPHEVAGSCSIGKNSVGDLSRCLAANGARVAR